MTITTTIAPPALDPDVELEPLPGHVCRGAELLGLHLEASRGTWTRDGAALYARHLAKRFGVTVQTIGAWVGQLVRAGRLTVISPRRRRTGINAWRSIGPNRYVMPAGWRAIRTTRRRALVDARRRQQQEHADRRAAMMARSHRQKDPQRSGTPYHEAGGSSAAATLPGIADPPPDPPPDTPPDPDNPWAKAVRKAQANTEAAPADA